jgi:5'-3' exonuclease
MLITLLKTFHIFFYIPELLEKGLWLPPEKARESHFDSNCITPGTPFMAR